MIMNILHLNIDIFIMIINMILMIKTIMTMMMMKIMMLMIPVLSLGSQGRCRVRRGHSAKRSSPEYAQDTYQC